VDFTEFFRAEHRKLIRFVMTLDANSDQAAEIAQATFFKALQAWGTIRNPLAWIRRVAVNELAAARRAAHREAPCATLPDAQVSLSAALAVELGDEARRVLTVLATLPPKQREVMAWIIDGFSASEIARELGVRPDLVRQNHSRPARTSNGSTSRCGGRRDDQAAAECIQQR
jgi:RNA polymerase sigma factor (sigma-70 family)